MTLRVIKNPIDSFWFDQNQKLLAHPFFMSERSDFYGDVWHFSDGRGITSVDFSVFDSPIFNIDSPARLKKNESECILSCKEYAKLFCMAVLTPKSSRSVLPAYQMVMHLLPF